MNHPAAVFKDCLKMSKGLEDTNLKKTQKMKPILPVSNELMEWPFF